MEQLFHAPLAALTVMTERVLKAIQEVQKAAEADDARIGQAHVDLLDAVRKLSEAAETPAERLMRMRFQVRSRRSWAIALQANPLPHDPKC